MLKIFDFFKKKSHTVEKPKQDNLYKIFKIGKLTENENTIFWCLINPLRDMGYAKDNFHPENGHKVESYGSGKIYNVFEFLDYRVLLEAINKCLEGKLVTPHIVVTDETAKIAREFTQGRKNIDGLVEFGLYQLSDQNKVFSDRIEYIQKQIQELNDALKKVYPKGKIIINSDHFIDRNKAQDYIQQIMHQREQNEVRAKPQLYINYVNLLNDLNEKHSNLHFVRSFYDNFNPNELEMAIGAIEEKISKN